MPLALSSFFLSTNKAFTLERHYNQRRIRSLNDRLKVFNSQGDPNFEKSAKEFAERIRRSSSNAFKSLKDKARDFDKKNDVRRKAKQLLNSAVEQYEVLEFKAKRRGSKFLRENKLDEKFDQASRSMRETIEDIDYKFRIKQRTSVAVEDFQRNWPRYRRSIDSFLATPLGSVVQWTIILTLIFNGWAFKIASFLFLLTPLLLYFAAKNSLAIQGQCPNCGFPYAGAKNYTIACKSCGGIVWRPQNGNGTKFDKNDPNVIDIDVD